MTKEKLNEILEITSYFVDAVCVSEKDGHGYNISFSENFTYNIDNGIYFYLASYEFEYDTFELACDIADEILEELNF